MRPVVRGAWPTDSSGKKKSFDKDYKLAKADLLTRLGDYCSYCERFTDLDVEHVVPKKKAPKLEFDWTNFLLGCGNCNSIKGSKNSSRAGHMWPDRDDTFDAFVYFEGGIVKVSPSLSVSKRNRANKLFKLVGLDRTPNMVGSASDPRWRLRRTAWEKATRAKTHWDAGRSTTETILDLAASVGFFSVWMTVFADSKVIRADLVKSFAGTDPSYFN